MNWKSLTKPLVALLGLSLSGCTSAQVTEPVAPQAASEASPPAQATPKQEAPADENSAEVQLRFPRGELPWLGVRLRATEPDDPGVTVEQVFVGSPAEHAGLQEGDVLVSLGETPVQAPVEVAEWVRAQKTGGSHPVSILRTGEPQLLRVTLEGVPEFEDRVRLALVVRPAPEIAGVATFQGSASSLSELRGRVVVLEFWASFCGVCRYLAPRLDEWHRTYRPQGAEVVGITVDPPNLGKQVAQKTGMSYTLASDPGAKVTRSYLADQIPLIVVIDRAGIVRDAVVGYSELRLRETETLIHKLLAQGT